MTQLSMSMSLDSKILLIVAVFRAVICTYRTDAPKRFDCTQVRNTYSDGVYLAKELELHGGIRSPCKRNATDLSVFVLKGDTPSRRKTSRILFCTSRRLSKITVVFTGDIASVLKNGHVTVTPLCHKKNVMEITLPRLSENDHFSSPEVQVFVTSPKRHLLGSMCLSPWDQGPEEIYNLTSEGSEYLQPGYNLAPNSRSVRESVEYDSVNITDKSMCGKTHGCFSYGEVGCQHLNCTYFVSYRTNADETHIEISAQTEGWVAIGFSSDNKMGGDGVIACLATDYKSTEYIVGVFTNPYVHEPPVENEDGPRTQLVSFRKADGYIYCYIKVMSRQSNMDFSNDFYQLYAWGELGIGGKMEKHSRTPYVSQRRLLLINKDSYHTSRASVSASGTIWLFILFILRFGSNNFRISY